MFGNRYIIHFFLHIKVAKPINMRVVGCVFLSSHQGSCPYPVFWRFMNLRAIIVDDEYANRDLLRILIKSYCKKIDVIALATSVDEAIDLIESDSPDVVFLDVEMPQKDGFALLRHFGNPSFRVVFVTAHEHYAIKALKNNAFDFMLKPVENKELIQVEKRLLKVLNPNGVAVLQDEYYRKVDNLLKEIARLQRNRVNKIFIPTTNGFRMIDAEHIEFIEAEGNYTTLHLQDGGKVVVTKSIKDFELTLPVEQFYRCHKSYLINLSHLESFSQNEGNICETSSGFKIPVARRKQVEFMEKIYQFTGNHSGAFE